MISYFVQDALRSARSDDSIPSFGAQQSTFAGVPSYASWPQIPYLRLPAISPVKVGDPVVFNYPMDNMPVDKKENYVKRCVGTPGDSLEVIDTKVFVNGNAMQFPDRSFPQFLYYVQTNGQGFSKKRLKKDFDINYLHLGTATQVPHRSRRLSAYSDRLHYVLARTTRR